MTTPKKIRPTESELEILIVLWEKGSCTVREVHEALAKNKDAGYTTTLKLMQIMHEKGLLKRDASARTHVYEAAFSRELIQEQQVERMIRTLFKGSAAKLVMQALGHHRSSADELAAIKAYLQQLEHTQKK